MSQSADPFRDLAAVGFSAEQTTDAQPHRAISLLDLVLSTQSSTPDDSGRLVCFLKAESSQESLEIWFGRPISGTHDCKDRIARDLNRHVAIIDEVLNTQLNQIIHNTRFQRLEATWRGIDYLCDTLQREFDPGGPGVKLKLLNISWRELEADFEEAWDVEKSCIFYKVYEEEFGRAGGEPFGLLIGDYEIKPPMAKGHRHDDLNIIDNMAKVAASAFSPFVCNASPELFDLKDFGDLELSRAYGDSFSGPLHLRWRSLCSSEDARFIGLTMPRVLMRTPYDRRSPLTAAKRQERQSAKTVRRGEFCFEENTSTRQSYLWGGAAFAFAAVVIRSFCRSSWLADIRGVKRGADGGGLLQDLPVESFATDSEGVVRKFSADVIITDELEKDLSDLGFIPLCTCYDTGHSAFYSARSIQIPTKYQNDLASLNAHISSMLHSMLCVSRFAHYLKVIGREWTGRSTDADQIQKELHNWIMDYVTRDISASPETRAKRPLFDAAVKVQPVQGKSGAYRAVFHLQPHYEIEGMNSGISLVTELKEPGQPK